MPYCPKSAKIALKLTLESLKCPQYVRVEHKICTTICGTPLRAILDHKILIGLAGGREGKNLPQKWPKFGFEALPRTPETNLKWSPLIDLTPVRAISDHKNLTGLVGEVRKGQNLPKK